MTPFRCAASVVAIHFFGLTPLVAADVITLRDGNQVKCLVLDHKGNERELHVLTARRELVVPRSQVREIQAGAPVAERYEEARALMRENDATAQFELARWCDANGLEDEARLHLEAVLKVQPDHAEARRLLGNPKQPAAVEAPPDPAAESPIAPVTDKDSLAVRRRYWDRAVKRLATWLESGTAERVEAARKQLSEINDPMAVGALVRALNVLNQDNRSRITTTINQIPGPEATAALGLIAVVDVSPDLRWLAVEQLRGRDPVAYRPALIAALRSTNREAILNAAEAAAELDEVALSPHLIGALTTESQHSYISGGFTTVTNGWIVGTLLQESELPIDRF